MINEIGENAGKIWQYLSQRPQAALRDVNKTLRQGDNMLFVAIGRPPREGKVVFNREGKRVKISPATENTGSCDALVGRVSAWQMLLPKQVAETQRIGMKSKYFSTVVAFLVLATCLVAPTVGTAHVHKTKVGNWGYLPFEKEAKVGNLTLLPGRYRFEHRAKGADHFARFSRITWAVTSHYRVVGEVKCRLEPLPAKVKRTNVQVTHEDGVDRVTRIEVRGENVAHLF